MFLGCGCKEKPKSPMTPKVIQVNDAVELMAKPLYTTEDITRIENWLSSPTKEQSETDWVFEFNRQHFGEHMMGYCDSPCQNRIKKRVEHMKEKLQQYGK